MFEERYSCRTDVVHASVTVSRGPRARRGSRLAGPRPDDRGAGAWLDRLCAQDDDVTSPRSTGTRSRVRRRGQDSDSRETGRIARPPPMRCWRWMRRHRATGSGKPNSARSSRVSGEPGGRVRHRAGVGSDARLSRRWPSAADAAVDGGGRATASAARLIMSSSGWSARGTARGPWPPTKLVAWRRCSAEPRGRIRANAGQMPPWCTSSPGPARPGARQSRARNGLAADHGLALATRLNATWRPPGQDYHPGQGRADRPADPVLDDDEARAVEAQVHQAGPGGPDPRRCARPWPAP
jgi:hypothetical protein